MSDSAVGTGEGAAADTVSARPTEPLAVVVPQSQGARYRAEERHGARSKADELAREVARLQRCEHKSAERILRLRTALRTLLTDFERCVKVEKPLAGALRELPTVLREAYAALED